MYTCTNYMLYIQSIFFSKCDNTAFHMLNQFYFFFLYFFCVLFTVRPKSIKGITTTSASNDVSQPKKGPKNTLTPYQKIDRAIILPIYFTSTKTDAGEKQDFFKK